MKTFIIESLNIKINETVYTVDYSSNKVNAAILTLKTVVDKINSGAKTTNKEELLVESVKLFLDSAIGDGFYQNMMKEYNNSKAMYNLANELLTLIFNKRKEVDHEFID